MPRYWKVLTAFKNSIIARDWLRKGDTPPERTLKVAIYTSNLVAPQTIDILSTPGPSAETILT